ncbi:MAG TPA: RNA polymerase sigma-54 factor, partial [Sphingomicrobium sp.]|nr:RNA polymerase sigma-54 factor [Sphingomicrobium sp.]
MALGPRLDIRQSQSLVLTPQLTQAIRLLQLSNMELEAVIAEEIAKNPLLEASSGEDDGSGEAPPSEAAELGDDPAEPGADELMVASDGTQDQPLDFDWNSEALETDSFADVGTGGTGGEDGPDFERMEYAAGSLAEHLQNQLHGASGQVGDLARAIAEMLDETGYLTVPVRDIAEATGASAAVVE